MAINVRLLHQQSPCYSLTMTMVETQRILEVFDEGIVCYHCRELKHNQLVF
jgi:hypothetical protein